MVPLKESLAIFDEATMPALRAKSERLTAFLGERINEIPSDDVTIITPDDPARRGNQLSIAVRSADPRTLFDQLAPNAVVCDSRPPNIVRVAPTPLYNTFADCHRFAGVLTELLSRA
jgi:kynureninase